MTPCACWTRPLDGHLCQPEHHCCFRDLTDTDVVVPCGHQDAGMNALHAHKGATQ